MSQTHDVAILGASGYTGAELVRLIATHPGLRIAALTADRKAGQSMGEVFPHLRHLDLPTLTTIDAVDFAEIDLAFCALPHATSQEVIAALPRDLKIVDLSADFRLRDPAVYEQWYGHPHRALDLQAEAVYGLTEFYRDEIRGRPPRRRHRLQRRDRHLRPPAAAPRRRHRPRRHHHRPRHRRLRRRPLAQGGHAARRGLRGLPRLQRRQAPPSRRVRPGVLQGRRPHGRGHLRAAPPAAEPRHPRHDLRPRRRRRRSTRRSREAYAGEPFLVVLPYGEAPATRHVRGSNFVHLGVIPDRRPGRVMVFSTLDNLTKGSSGQAIQNANLMLGLPETMGLMAAPLFP